MRLLPRFSPYLPLIVCAGIAICFSASRINADMLSAIGISTTDGLWDSIGEMESYEIVLQVIVISVVPGFCEEFLFRGAILENCLPFGRGKAIFISAFLFAMMHQNPGQLFYTFVAGLVLGLVYEQTGSIWNGTVLHVLNNFVSILQTLLYETAEDQTDGMLKLFLLEGIVCLLGIGSVCILIARRCSQREKPQNGFFGKELPASDSYALCPVEGRRSVRLFCTFPMLLFLILCAVQVLLIILLSMGGAL